MQAIRTINSSGQIQLDRRYAGRNALVDEVEPGVWRIKVKVGKFIPDNERWLHEPEVKASLEEALRWESDHPNPVESDLDELERRIEGGAE